MISTLFWLFFALTGIIGVFFYDGSVYALLFLLVLIDLGLSKISSEISKKDRKIDSKILAKLERE